MRRSLLVLAALLVVVPSAAAAPDALQPTAFTISQQDASATDPKIVVTPDGTTIVAWRTGGAQAPGDIFVSTRRPAEDFGAPVQVSSGGEAFTAPLLGVAADGAVTLVWMQQAAGFQTPRVVASRRPPGGAFGAAVPVSPPNPGAYEARLGVAPDGTVTILWFTPFGYELQTTTRAPDGTFGAPLVIPAGPGGPAQRSPELTVGPDGTLVVAWVRGGAGDEVLMASARPPGGSFSQAEVVSSGGHAISGHRVAFAADGTAVLSWLGTESGVEALQASIRLAGGSFGDPVTLGASASGPLGIFPAPDGTLAVLWRDGQQTRVTVRPAGGALGASSPAPESDGAARPLRLAGADGSLSVAQVRSNGAGQPVVEYLTRLAGGGFEAGVPLSGPLDVVNALDAALLPDGNLTVAWATTIAGRSLVQVRWTGPPSRAVVIPPPPPPSGPSIPEPDPPLALRRALITGVPKVGRTLTCTRRAFKGATRTSVRWLRTAYPIPGAVRSRYKLTRRDRGKRITCEVRAAGPGGSARMVSRAVLVRR